MLLVRRSFFGSSRTGEDTRHCAARASSKFCIFPAPEALYRKKQNFDEALASQCIVFLVSKKVLSCSGYLYCPAAAPCNEYAASGGMWKMKLRG